MLASEMLLFSFLLASSLCVPVDRRVVFRLHLLPMLSTPDFYPLLVVLANALNILRGLQILRTA
jgi:hypothetical protein